jgi:hypothetical protein
MTGGSVFLMADVGGEFGLIESSGDVAFSSSVGLASEDWLDCLIWGIEK